MRDFYSWLAIWLQNKLQEGTFSTCQTVKTKVPHLFSGYFSIWIYTFIRIQFTPICGTLESISQISSPLISTAWSCPDFEVKNKTSKNPKSKKSWKICHWNDSSRNENDLISFSFFFRTHVSSSQCSTWGKLAFPPAFLLLNCVLLACLGRRVTLVSKAFPTPETGAMVTSHYHGSCCGAASDSWTRSNRQRDFNNNSECCFRIVHMVGPDTKGIPVSFSWWGYSRRICHFQLLPCTQDSCEVLSSDLAGNKTTLANYLQFLVQNIASLASCISFELVECKWMRVKRCLFGSRYVFVSACKCLSVHVYTPI